MTEVGGHRWEDTGGRTEVGGQRLKDIGAIRMLKDRGGMTYLTRHYYIVISFDIIYPHLPITQQTHAYLQHQIALNSQAIRATKSEPVLPNRFNLCYLY